MTMLIRVLLLSLALFGASCDNAPQYAVHQIMRVVERAYEHKNVDEILYLMDTSFNYTMCGYTGTLNNFKGYLENQMDTLMDLKLLVDYDNADIETKDDMETLTFHVDSAALYKDRSRVEGGAVVTAINKKYAPIFYISHIHQQCRVTAKRHHRLYRLFTNENLYDYRK